MSTPSELNQRIDPVADLENAVLDAATELAGEGRRPDAARLSRPPKADFGDYSSNAPMLLAPRCLASRPAPLRRSSARW